MTLSNPTLKDKIKSTDNYICRNIGIVIDVKDVKYHINRLQKRLKEEFRNQVNLLTCYEDIDIILDKCFKEEINL